MYLQNAGLPLVASFANLESVNTVMTLPEGLSRELERVVWIRQLLREEPSALMWIQMMTEAIERAHLAQGSGDIGTMIFSLKELKQFTDGFMNLKS